MNEKAIFTNDTFAVADYLYKHCDEENAIKINQTQLAKDMDLSRPTIGAIIKNLREADYIWQEDGDSKYYLSQNLIDIIVAIQTICARNRDWNELHELIYERAHEFCSEEMDNNTMVGYILYCLKSCGHFKNEIFRALEVYIYLKWHCKSVDIYEYINNNLYENTKFSHKDYAVSSRLKENNYSGIYLVNELKVELKDASKETEDNFLYNLQLHFEQPTQHNYLFCIPKSEYFKFVIACVYIDRYIVDKLDFMKDTACVLYNKNSVIMINDDRNVDETKEEIEKLINTLFKTKNPLFGEKKNVFAIHLEEEWMPVSELAKQQNIFVINKNTYMQNESWRALLALSIQTGFFVEDENKLFTGKELPLYHELLKNNEMFKRDSLYGDGEVSFTGYIGFSESNLLEEPFKIVYEHENKYGAIEEQTIRFKSCQNTVFKSPTI